LQIPAEIEALKVSDPAMAQAWRYQLRALAVAAFAAGYRVVDFARDGEVGLYLLEQG
jgi:predicted GNAT superfamily acetyltransferase